MNDERDELWELLGKAKKPVVSPFFAANVLREVRQTHRQPVRIMDWLRRQWRAAALTATALLIVGFTLNHWRAETERVEGDRMLLAQVATSPDYDIINHLDELLAVQETSLWIDPSVE